MAQSTGSAFAAKSAPIHQLEIASLFDGLSEKEQRYAHHMSRAAWRGSRIILRQTSPEAGAIFDGIESLHRQCRGNWSQLSHDLAIEAAEMDAFLNFAACFLSNIGNYYGSGDQKFVPEISRETLDKLCDLGGIDQDTRTAMITQPPFCLGFPSKTAQSAYYPGPHSMTKNEISTISRVLKSHGIWPENTRLLKELTVDEKAIYKVLQASMESGQHPRKDSPDVSFVIETGDHKHELSKICEELRLAKDFTANNIQRRTLDLYIESFITGNLDIYRDGLRSWVTDIAPTIENIFGFVEPYSDPYGIRAEFEGLVGIADPKETQILRKLVIYSDEFIRTLPWCTGQEENNGKGPFEKSLFEPPDFSSIHVLAYCSSIIFPGINLPNYNDIRQDCGFKNVIIANRMTAESSNLSPSPFVAAEEAEIFQKHKFPAYYIWVVLHELFGHGTGKMLCQSSDGTFNFDRQNLPIDPVTRQPVSKWYMPDQTWTGQFEDLATTVDECRAELVGAYLMDNKQLLALFGFEDDTEISADDLTYNIYMQLATDGLRGLQNFNVDDATWGQAHSRAHFATLKCLLRDGKGSVKVEFDPESQRLTVRVDRSTILPFGKAALEGMLLRLHIYRSTADAKACRAYYEDLSSVDGEYCLWRDAVLATKQAKLLFVHPNTFLADNGVHLKEYPATPQGIIESWVDRNV